LKGWNKFGRKEPDEYFISRPCDYTGKILACSNFIMTFYPESYSNKPFHEEPWMYRNVTILKFERGQLTGSEDLSEKYAAIRKEKTRLCFDDK
jgi:hypothetical protein